ncbi:unnamed protein product, partial [Rotaria sp. Silwood1]
ITYNNHRLNVEPKTRRIYPGNANNGPQGSTRNNNYQTRGGGGIEIEPVEFIFDIEPVAECNLAIPAYDAKK